MADLDTALPALDAGRPGTLSELLVEVFITRGAHHHGDVQEAADEFRDLFASFGILTEENEAMIRGRALRIAQRAERERLRTVDGETLTGLAA